MSDDQKTNPRASLAPVDPEQELASMLLASDAPPEVKLLAHMSNRLLTMSERLNEALEQRVEDKRTIDDLAKRVSALEAAKRGSNGSGSYPSVSP